MIVDILLEQLRENCQNTVFEKGLGTIQVISDESLICEGWMDDLYEDESGPEYEPADRDRWMDGLDVTSDQRFIIYWTNLWLV